MLYRFVQCWIRLTLLLFCRRVYFSNRELLKHRGPLLLALNHPNSFFDAVLVGSHFDRPVHFLARGDAFRNPVVKKILSALKLIPIYRLTEGREYLALNDATFDQCREILMNDGIVLIFSEGLCANQWAIRDLKKGTARIALDTWARPGMAERFRVQPVSLNYHSFSHFGKRVLVHFGEPIHKRDLADHISEGEKLRQFNQLLFQKLKQGLIEGNGHDELVQFLISNSDAYPGPAGQLIERLKNKREILLNLSSVPRSLLGPRLMAHNAPQAGFSFFVVLLLLPFALAGWLLNAPLYFPLKHFIKRKTSGTIFFDSVLFGTLLLAYPLYWLIVNLCALFFIESNFVHLLLLFMPVLAWVLLLWKDNLEKWLHFLLLSARVKSLLPSIFN